MALSNAARQIWELCEIYIAIAHQHLSGATPIPRPAPTTFDSRAEEMRIQFLFPTIGQDLRDLLVSLRSERFMCRAAEALDQQDHTIMSAHTAETFEAEFEHHKKAIEPHLPLLSPIQQELVREKYLSD